MGKEVFGKKIKSTLQEIVRPEDTALIIVDMQNDFCSEKGHFGQCGKNLLPIRKMIPNLSRLIRRAREKEVLVIYIQNTQSASGTYLSPAAISHMLLRWGDESKLSYTIEGTWGHGVIEELKPREGELIVRKHRPSAFVGTDLDLILRSMGKGTIIVTGVVTEGCVESTARDGWLKDYYVVVVEDCVASGAPELHEPQLKLMKQIYFVVSSEELMREGDRIVR